MKSRVRSGKYIICKRFRFQEVSLRIQEASNSFRKHTVSENTRFWNAPSIIK